MNKNILAVVAVVAALAIGFVGFNWGSSSGQLGAVINYYSSLNNVRLYTTLNSLLTDITAVRAPLSGLVSTTTASIIWPSTSTSTANTTTTLGGIPAAKGDLVLIAPVLPTDGIVYNAHVSTASTTSATFAISAMNASGTVAITPASTTFKLWVLPSASFAAPAALTTTATTSSAGL